ncbi:MAG TPA: RDD family protein, partial [Gemmatimonadales bacterium]|nr:RDD family protein [Gemmatimonadales bacterium]
MTREVHPNDGQLGLDDSPPLYANFLRRLNALSLDTVVLVLLSVLIFSLASVFEDVEPMRIALVILWWVLLLFYEPLLVWRLGGTVGHRAMNLRVFDDRTDRNVSLFQAVARFWVKALL